MTRLLLPLVLVLLLAPRFLGAQVQVEQKGVSGACNVALGVNQGKVEVKCGLHEAALKPLADKLNAIRKEQKLQDKQINSLVYSVNLLMGTVLTAQDRIMAEVRESGRAQTEAMTRLLKEQLAQTEAVIQQQVARVSAQISGQGGEAIEKFKQEALSWRRKYEELLAKWEKVQGEEQADRALQALQAGDLDRSGAILDEILAAQDEVAVKAALNHFRRARIFELQFRPNEALAHYDAAYRFAPDSLQYAHVYALLLQTQKQFRKAARVYEDNLKALREVAAVDPGVKNSKVYEAYLAMTLNNLGNLYLDTQRFAETEKAFGEARDRYRKLAARYPEAFAPNLAATLNNLGIFYRATKRFAEAEQAYGAALDLRRKLARENPEAYAPDLAATLNNLGVLYGATKRFAEAEQAYGEALDLRRKLAGENPEAYGPDLVDTLSNLGVLYGPTKRFAEAEKAYKEALSISRQLAKLEPRAHIQRYGATLAQLVRLYERTGRAKEVDELLNAEMQAAPEVFKAMLAGSNQPQR